MSTVRPQRTDGHELDEFKTSQHLKLTWIEENANLEYTVRFNASRPGFWIVESPQKGE